MKQQHPQGEDDDGKRFLSPVVATKFFLSSTYCFK
jgi:hypothetical protein